MARVLIIDDDATNVKIWEESLRDTCRTFFSASGQDGLTMAAEIDPDLVILNQMMPDISGHELAMRLRAADKRGHLQIVLRSAVGGIVDARSGLMFWADLCIPRTIDIAVAVFKIRSLLKSQRQHALSQVMDELETWRGQAAGKKGADQIIAAADQYAALISGEIVATCINLGEWLSSLRTPAQVDVSPCDGVIVIGNRGLLSTAVEALVEALKRRAPTSRVTLTVENGERRSDIHLTAVGGPPFRSDERAMVFDFDIATKSGRSAVATALARKIILRHGGYVACRNDAEGHPAFKLVLPIQRACAGVISHQTTSHACRRLSDVR